MYVCANTFKVKMLSTLTPFDTLETQVAHYRANLEKASKEARENPAFGHIDVARWVYVAETDAKARRELGYAPKVPFDQAMRETMAWYKQNT